MAGQVLGLMGDESSSFFGREGGGEWSAEVMCLLCKAIALQCGSEVYGRYSFGSNYTRNSLIHQSGVCISYEIFYRN